MPEYREQRVVDQAVTRYSTFLKEPYRPPSRGGNTSAIHAHVLIIGGERYSFLARGSRKWVFKGDTVSFDYTIAKGKYRDIDKGTLATKNKKGRAVIRGDRREKPATRFALARMPVSRREQRDLLT